MRTLRPGDIQYDLLEVTELGQVEPGFKLISFRGLHLAVLQALPLFGDTYTLRVSSQILLEGRRKSTLFPWFGHQATR